MNSEREYTKINKPTVKYPLKKRRKTYLSKYASTPIPGALSAWNLVTCPGSDLAVEVLEFTNRSSTAASTLTRMEPSAASSGVGSMVVVVEYY